MRNLQQLYPSFIFARRISSSSLDIRTVLQEEEVMDKSLVWLNQWLAILPVDPLFFLQDLCTNYFLNSLRSGFFWYSFFLSFHHLSRTSSSSILWTWPYQNNSSANVIPDTFLYSINLLENKWCKNISVVMLREMASESDFVWKL